LYAEACYYSAELGRFVSADPLFVERPEVCVERVLECGLYGYALNNPMKYVDPTGELVPLVVGLGAGITALTSALVEYNHSGSVGKSIIAGASGAVKGAVGAALMAGVATAGAGVAALSGATLAYSKVAGSVNFLEEAGKATVDFHNGKKVGISTILSDTIVSTGIDTVAFYGGGTIGGSIEKAGIGFADEIGVTAAEGISFMRTTTGYAVGSTVKGTVKEVVRDASWSYGYETIKTELKTIFH